jgi:uncharacterized protein DUF3611
MSTDYANQPIAHPEQLSRDFLRLGRLGFWMQVILLIVPLLLLLYVLVLRTPDPTRTSSVDLANYLSIGSLALLAFTTFWFYRYIGLADMIADPDRRPSREVVINKIWIGIWAGCIGIAFSMILLFSAVGSMLFTLLTLPPGVVIAPASTSGSAEFVTAADAVTLLSVIIVLTAELIVLGLSIWLLFQATRNAKGGANQAT